MQIIIRRDLGMVSLPFRFQTPFPNLCCELDQMIFYSESWREPGWIVVWERKNMACPRRFFLVNFPQMERAKKKEVFQVICPCCQSLLWLDPVSREVIQSKKGAAKKKQTLDELLLKEKKRKSGFERKFEATAELEKERKKKAEEGFKKALSRVDKED